MVYIIFGGSGSGKTTLLEILNSEYSNVSIHVKGTTRERRQYDDEELEYYDDDLPTKYDYIYSQYGHDYGIEKLQISSALAKKINHFVICNDVKTVNRLKKDFPAQVRVIFLFFDAPKETIRAIQETKNISDDEIELRLNKYDALQKIFSENSNLFDEIINNTYGQPPNSSLRKQIDRIMYNDSNDTTALNKLVEYLKRQEEEEANKNAVCQKGLLFIIMSMQEDDQKLKSKLDSVFITIKNAAEISGFNPARVDETFGFNTINEKILKHIELSEIIIADLTFERPNCYYELGYAHAKNKNVILTAEKGTRIHFDVSNYKVIFYNSMMQLDDELKKHLKEYTKNKTHN